jgi:glycosyltransferase involved in cell wall biosynthesis
VPSLLPWIAASRGVLVPASTTYAKLDHPRVLLEAMALGVRIIVGTAPSLGELVDDPRVGEIAKDPSELREAMERCFELDPPPPEALVRVLAARRPATVAARYAELYRRALTGRPR